MPRILLVAIASIALATFGVWRFAPQFLEGAPQGQPAFAPVRALCHWDCWWYVSIARDGYFYTPGTQSPVAYFPAYPMAIRGLSVTGFDPFTAGVLVSLVAGVLAVFLFRRLGERIAPEQAAFAESLLLVYPWSFYLFGVVYSDALFLLLVVSAFLCLERGQRFGAAAFGALAVLCRPVAPAVVLGLTVRSLELRRRAGERLRPVEFVPALAGLALLGWMWWLDQRFGDPLAFVHVQDAPGWAQPPGFRSWLKLEFFETVLGRFRPLALLKLGSQGAVAMGAIALAWPVAKRVGWGYAVYLAVVIGIPLVSSKDFQGLGRYVLAGFPAFFGFAHVSEGKPWLRRAAIALGLVGFAALAIAFGADQYVA